MLFFILQVHKCAPGILDSAVTWSAYVGLSVSFSLSKALALALLRLCRSIPYRVCRQIGWRNTFPMQMYTLRYISSRGWIHAVVLVHRFLPSARSPQFHTKILRCNVRISTACCAPSRTPLNLGAAGGGGQESIHMHSHILYAYMYISARSRCHCNSQACCIFF